MQEIKSTPDLNLTPKAKAEFAIWFRDRHYPLSKGTSNFLKRYKTGASSKDFILFLSDNGVQLDSSFTSLAEYKPSISAKSSNKHSYGLAIKPPKMPAALIAAIEAGFARIEAELLG